MSTIKPSKCSCFELLELGFNPPGVGIVPGCGTELFAVCHPSVGFVQTDIDLKGP